MKFRDLKPGQFFDFVSAEIGYNSFFKVCRKLSARKYIDSDGDIHHIGSINADVYNVKEA